MEKYGCRNIIGKIADDTNTLVTELEIDMTLRPEKLSLTDYVKISDAISESTKSI